MIDLNLTRIAPKTAKEKEDDRLFHRCHDLFDKRKEKYAGNYDFGDFAFDLYKEVQKLKRRLNKESKA